MSLHAAAFQACRANLEALLASVILFIFALTSGGGDKWGSPAVITTLVISVLASVAFFYWETRVDKGHAALSVYILPFETDASTLTCLR